MAKPQCNQTHPKYHFRFLAINRADRKAKPCRLSIEATSEQEARQILAPISFSHSLAASLLRRCTMFKIIITTTDHTTGHTTSLTDPRRYKNRNNAEKAAQKIGYICKPDGKTIALSVSAEVLGVRSSEPPPAVGDRYAQNDGGMTAIVRQCTGKRVVFSYEQYPAASHDYSLEAFVRDFTRQEVRHA